MSDAPLIEFLNTIRREFDVETTTLVPMDMPDLFIRVDFGSGRADTPITETRLVAVQVYGTDLDEVVELAYNIRMFLIDRVYATNPKIVWWNEQAGPHEYPDPDLEAVFRWQITGNLTLTLT